MKKVVILFFMGLLAITVQARPATATIMSKPGTVEKVSHPQTNTPVYKPSSNDVKMQHPSNTDPNTQQANYPARTGIPPSGADAVASADKNSKKNASDAKGAALNHNVKLASTPDVDAKDANIDAAKKVSEKYDASGSTAEFKKKANEDVPGFLKNMKGNIKDQAEKAKDQPKK